ncbi:succinate dehydrogenase cytochrome b subunit [Streptomonospora wellingtoniae]|uniref:Succinate dehydrogenase cytochrome b subunit n=1 Tax=Streptomonospora wellingtoniae TaxID=3075544 RepID=A0ABU2KT84_9ACTN|nr:succinate dehydrogenase cytochrome b subunit [Streptomonospora sp. DSM 45055]MDT0302338.1 succinate dehydrogenase cytochrome b subunit [Streptomonospora sp. DSM 45055]
MANSTLTKQRSEALGSTVALKSAMAVTGVILVLFLIAHMYGNLNVFAGRQAFDNYSHHLRELGEPMLPHGGFLWIMRVVLLASVLIHIYAAVVLWRRAGRARPVRYQVTKRVQRSYSSYTMRYGGIGIALFAVFHVLHLTTNTIHPGGPSDSPYERMVSGFQPEFWYVTLFYVAAVLAVGFHLRHGIWSALTTLGANRQSRQRSLNIIATVIAAGLTIGFLLTPLSVTFGLVG